MAVTDIQWRYIALYFSYFAAVNDDRHPKDDSRGCLMIRLTGQGSTVLDDLSCPLWIHGVSSFALEVLHFVAPL